MLQFPQGAEDFLSPQSVQTSSGAHTAFCSVGMGALSLGVMWPGLVLWLRIIVAIVPVLCGMCRTEFTFAVLHRSTTPPDSFIHEVEYFIFLYVLEACTHNTELGDMFCCYSITLHPFPRSFQLDCQL